MKIKRAVSAALVLFQMITMPLGYSAEEIRPEVGIEPRISVSFDGAQLRDVLVVLSQQSGFNFVATQEVEAKKVTVYLDNVSPKEALEAIISANGLSYTQMPGNIVIVKQSTTAISGATATMPTELRVFRLKHARLSSSPLDVGGQSVIDSLSESSVTSASSSGSSSSSTSSSTSGSSDRGIDRVVAKMMSSQGKMATDLRTNSLLVIDTAENLALIERAIRQLDVPSRQVVLEAHIMEVQKSLLSDRGIDWGGTDGALLSYAGGARTTAFPFGENLFSKNQGVKPTNFVDTAGSVASAGDPQAVSSMSFGTISATNFAAVLRFVQTDSKTKILARPRILTQNNEAAQISVLTNQTIGITNTETSVNGEVAGTASDVAERQDVGIQLKMTPQINDDDSVMLFVEPIVSTASTSSFSADFLDPRTRGVRTMARVKDNQTLVIGGLIESNESGTNKKIPFLGDIPLIGGAFSYQSRNDVDRELLVFITPHIVKNADVIAGNPPFSGSRDLAVKRMLDEFRNTELDKTDVGLEKSFSPVTQARLKPKKALDPRIEKMMTQAMDAQESRRPSGSLDQVMGKALESKAK